MFVTKLYWLLIRQGTVVEWQRGKRKVIGKVIESYTGRVTKTMAGQPITRYGENGDKVLFIEQGDGTILLKLEHTVERAS